MEKKKKPPSVVCISLLSLGLSGILLAGPDAVHGQIYKWVDAEGRIHFSDTPVDKAEVVDEELPPTSEFISPRPPNPPTPPEQTEPPNETDETDETQGAEDTPPPTTQTTDQAAEEEIGMGQYGPFGKDGPVGPDGPNGPTGLVDPQAGKK
jgi:hypothetical protein